MKNEESELARKQATKGFRRVLNMDFLVSGVREYGVMLDTIKNPIFSSVKQTGIDTLSIAVWL